MAKVKTPKIEDEILDMRDGYCLLAAPEGSLAVSWHGANYEVEDGFVIVPLEAIADLLNHGFLMGED